MKKLLLLMLAMLLCLTMIGLYGCGVPDEIPDEKESANADDPSGATLANTSHETEAETWLPQIGTLRGCLQGKTEDGLLKIKISSQYKGQRNVIVYVRVENAEDFTALDDVILTYDAARPVETMPTGEDILVAESLEYDLDIPVPKKPVIYLYPETPTEVSVTLTLDGRLTCTYPDYNAGWNHFTAHPDGTLIFPDGKEYYCLYWEGVQITEWDFSQGFCVKGEDTAEFLEWALAEQGLTPREANEFIIYWLPQMQENPYNVISFQTDAYTSTAVLEVTPAPDSTIRIMMAYYPSDEAVEIMPQTFETPVRDGFTVVEWGGSPVKVP